MPGELEVRSAQDLLVSPLEGVAWLVEELITTGLVVLAGTPKVGKSWFCLCLGLCVSLGTTFLDHATASKAACSISSMWPTTTFVSRSWLTS